MTRFETTLGGAARDFPDTTMGMVSRMRDASPESRRELLETLARRYWKPVYAFVRSAWTRTNDDAKDLTQAFFLWLFEGELLARYESGLASFRHYLKGLLRNFVRNSDQSLRRLKRGGGARAIAIEDAALQLADPAAATPEVQFDRAWGDELVAGATEVVRRRFSDSGRETQWRAFEAYDLAPEGKPTYGEVASLLGAKESDVRNWLFAVRDAIRKEVLARMADTAGSAGALEAEWRELFG